MAAAPDRSGVRIHETACVDEPCEIGDGTAIWHFSHVMPEAEIGEGCSLGQNVFIGRGVHIGSRVKIQNNVSIYEGVTVEDDVFCGPSLVFTNVINPRSEIERKDEYRPTHVGRGATLGANATIVCGHDIGAFAFIAAGAVVTTDVAPYALMMGVPATRRGWMCRCGTTLPHPELSCPTCGNTYRLNGERLEPIKEFQT